MPHSAPGSPVRNLTTLMLMLVCSSSAIPQATGKSPFAGKWQGTMHGQPGISVTVNDTSGRIHGAIIFFFQERGRGGKWHVKDKYEAALLSPTATGKVLTFEVNA
jgi:hypothetical protein